MIRCLLASAMSLTPNNRKYTDSIMEVFRSSASGKQA